MKLRNRQRTDGPGRALGRRFRILAAAVLALTVVLNVAPAAANHLTVNTSDLVNGAVKTPKLANGAVGTAKIKNGAVGTAKIINGAVKTSKLANGAVGTAKIKNGAVNRAKMAPGTVVARAYANVLAGAPVGIGVQPVPVDPARSKNIATGNVLVIFPPGPGPQPTTGHYCFVGLGFVPQTAVVTAENSALQASVIHGNAGFCPASTQLTVRLTNNSNQGAPGAFQIVIF